jgi:oligopeptide transport system substrate-binding protein
MVRESDRTFDQERRFALMREAERLALSDHAVIPIYFYAGRRLIATRVKGWIDNARNVNPTRYLRIEDR